MRNPMIGENMVLYLQFEPKLIGSDMACVPMVVTAVGEGKKPAGEVIKVVMGLAFLGLDALKAAAAMGKQLPAVMPVGPVAVLTAADRDPFHCSCTWPAIHDAKYGAASKVVFKDWSETPPAAESLMGLVQTAPDRADTPSGDTPAGDGDLEH